MGRDMALLPVIGPSGEPLLLDDGGDLVPALAEDPCECCFGCPCDDPDTIAVTLSVFDDPDFPPSECCIDISGTYILN